MRAVRGSSRRHSLQAALRWMEGRESTEAFDFAFGPMEEYLDELRTLTLEGKPFGVLSFRHWKSQLRLIEGCCSGQTGVVSELLTFGAAGEISLLFTFKTVGIPHHPRVSSWPPRRGGCGPAEGGYLGLSEIAQRVGCRRCIILSLFSVHCSRDLWSAFSVKSPEGRSVWRHATRDGELRQTGSKCHGGLSGVLFWRCGLMISSLSRGALAGLGSPVRSRKEEKAAALCS